MGKVMVLDWRGSEVLGVPGDMARVAWSISEACGFVTRQPCEVVYILDGKAA